MTNSTTKLEIDHLSLMVTCDTRLMLKQLERELDLRGFTLGYLPPRNFPSSTTMTLKKILDDKIPNVWEDRYGSIDDLCIALKVENPDGMIKTKITPRSATGPDLKKIFIGAKGRYGKISEVTLRVSPVPAEKIKIKAVFKNKTSQNDFLKILSGSGVRAACVKTSGLKLAIELHGMVVVARAERDWLLQEIRNHNGKVLS